MADDLDRVVEEAGIGRRTFLRRMLVGTAFATPVVASFAMSGIAAATPHPGSPIAPILPFCNNNTSMIGRNTTMSTITPNLSGGGDNFDEEFYGFINYLCGGDRH
jgi:hypothetical protein